MKNSFTFLFLIFLGLQVSATSEYEISAESVYETLDCAGTLGTAGNYQHARLSSSKSENSKAIYVNSKHLAFPKVLGVSKLHTNENEVSYSGRSISLFKDDVEPAVAFDLIIDKFGVHGAHNAILKMSRGSSEESYFFECYF